MSNTPRNGGAQPGPPREPSTSARDRLLERITRGDPKGSTASLTADRPQAVSADAVVDALKTLPAMPATVLKVMQITRDQECSAKQVSSVIRADTGFSVRLLRLANSAHYGLPRNVDTIMDAVVLLGVTEIRSLAIAAGSHEQLNRELQGYGLGSGDLWRHSFACGVAAQTLAARFGYEDPEEAFVAGLLHDIGKIAVSPILAKRLPEALEYMRDNAVSFTEAERKTLGFDSAQIGGLLANRWNLSPRLADAIALLPAPERNGEVVPLAAIAHVANAICLALGIGVGVDGLNAPLSQSALTFLGLTLGDLDGLVAQLVVDVAMEPLFSIADAENSSSRRAA